jgi:hypothetical protein
MLLIYINRITFLGVLDQNNLSLLLEFGNIVRNIVTHYYLWKLCVWWHISSHPFLEEHIYYVLICIMLVLIFWSRI